MNALQKLNEQLTQAISAAIDLYAHTGQLTRKMRIPIADIGVERVTLKLRQGAVARGKSLKMDIRYDQVSRGFHFTVELETVTMTDEQAKAFVAAREKAPKAA